ncbi:hypothetical protein ED312_20265 [Sinomicrobium pectinilyticum]|uniref:histidine kinase n=1 Tax=Sinomicrobium pectinilyticum TaxID=1084421 RepID=A0A3N0DQN3_SINP1|nr:triple tyrosine motif-containing protein [Sinomicrobium pectinilyticum]RNL77955.1 hypothetical protein ED312_20265 [Sinomicrobium pectinilyticum]
MKKNYSNIMFCLFVSIGIYSQVYPCGLYPFDEGELYLPGSIGYSYKLTRNGETYQDWSEPSHKVSAHFPLLPSGNYTFMVKATNRHGEWRDRCISYTFTIPPPFWKTGWFFILLFALSGGVALVIYRTRTRHVKYINSLQNDFFRQLTETREEERKRIARELHDGIGQSLVLLKARQEEERFSSQIQLLIDDIKRISGNLHPVYITSMGLSMSLEYLIRNIDEVSSVYFKSTISREVDEYFKKEKALHIYRIVQESLNNIIKHSDADEALISVGIKSGFLKIKVADNGKGTACNPAAGKPSMGLKTMKERIVLLGGEYKIVEKGELGGFEISFKIPISGQCKKNKQNDKNIISG